MPDFRPPMALKDVSVEADPFVSGANLAPLDLETLQANKPAPPPVIPPEDPYAEWAGPPADPLTIAKHTASEWDEWPVADEIDLATPEQLLDDPEFNVVQYIRNNPDAVQNPIKREKLEAAYRLKLKRGLDWGETLKQLYPASKELVPAMAVGAKDTLENLLNAGMQPAVNLVGSAFLPANERAALLAETKAGQKQAVAQLSAGSEAAAFGLANLMRKGAFKASHLKDSSIDKLTSDEIFAHAQEEIDFLKQAEDILKGQGVIAETAGLDAETLRKEGIEIDPAMVESISFADPITLVALPVALAKGGSMGFALVNKAGQIVARSKTGAQALNLASKLSGSVVDLTKGTANLAGKAATGSVELAGKGVSAVGRGVQSAASGSKGAARAVGAIAGAISGSELGVGGALAGAGLGARGGQYVATLAGDAGKVIAKAGDKLTLFGKQLAGTAAPGSLLKAVDAVQSSMAVRGATVGTLAAVPLAAMTDDEREAAMLLAGGLAIGGGFGGVIGGAKKIVGLRERYVGERLLDPFNRAEPPVVPDSPSYGSIPELDQVHEAQIGTLGDEAKASLNGVRELFRGDAEVYLMDPGSYKKVFMDAFEAKNGRPPTPEEAARIDAFAKTQAFFSDEVATPSGNNKVVFLNNDTGGLPHDTGHLFEALMPDAERSALQAEVAKRYTPEQLDAFQKLYEDALNRDIPEGQPRATLTKEQVVSEIIAENFSTLFSNQPIESLGTPRPVAERIAAFVARTAEKAGVDMTGGQGTAALGVKPSFSVIGMLENALKARAAERGVAAPRPEAAAPPPGGGAGAPPVSPAAGAEGADVRNKRVTQEQQNAFAAQAAIGAKIDEARAHAAASGDQAMQRNVETVAGAFQRKPGQITPVEVIYKGAKDIVEPGKMNQPRDVREYERVVAEAKEMLGSAPEDVRKLFQGVTVPIRFDVTQGNALHLLTMSLDKVVANLSRVAREATKRGGKSLVPYDLKEGKLTPQAWDQFVRDLTAYSENQQNGYRGDGQKLVRPNDATALQIFIPEENPNFNPTRLPEEVSNFLNVLMGAERGLGTPRTAREIKGKVAGNVKAQKLAEVNLRNVEEPVRVKPLTEAQEKKQTFSTGQTIKEVNPLRNALHRLGFDTEKLHAVNERIRMDRVQSITPRPELNFRAPVTDTIRGGFLPRVAAKQKAGIKPDSGKAERRVNPDVVAVARNYAKNRNLEVAPATKLSELNPDMMKEIADAFEAAQHSPDDPAVRASYQALAEQAKEQYRAMEQAGYTIEPFDGTGEPYKNSAEMLADVRDNKHLYFLKTDRAYGPGEQPISHPLLEPSGIEVSGQPLVNNDVFRAVHDFFGHAMEGTQFGPRGEFNAWRAHSEMFTPEAQGALAAETLAQNSWVNYGSHLRREDGSIPAKGNPDYVPAEQRSFGDQKAFIVPDEIINRAKEQAQVGVERGSFLPKLGEDTVTEYVKGVAALDGKNFKVAMDAETGGLTGAAVRLGDMFKTPEQVELLKMLEEQAKTQMREAVTAGDMDNAMLLASKPQFFREAREAATKTGSIGEAMARGQFGNKPEGAFLPRTAAGKELAKDFDIIAEGIAGNRTLQVIPKGGSKTDAVAWLMTHQQDPSTASVDSVHVVPEHRGKNIAEALYRELGAQLQEDGVTKLTGNVISDIPLRVRRKVFGEFETLENALGEVEPSDAVISRLEEARKARESGDTSFIELARPISRIDPEAQFLPKKRNEQKKLPLPPKAFIDPRGEFVTVNRNTHDDYLIENAASINKQFGTKIPAKQGRADVRILALNRGFVRMTYEPNSGRAVIEANVKQFGKPQRDRVFEWVVDNLDSIDNLRVSLVDDKGALVKSADRRFFVMDDDAQKLDSIPFVTDDGRPEVTRFFLPKAAFTAKDFSAEVERIATGEKFGETFNVDGTIFTPKNRSVDIVTLASKDVPVEDLTVDRVKEVLEPNSELLKSDGIKAGLFRIERKTEEGGDLVSVDLNAVVPQKFRKNTAAFARRNNQESFWDFEKGEVVATGGDGQTVLTDPADIKSAVDQLLQGSEVIFPDDVRYLPGKKELSSVEPKAENPADVVQRRIKESLPPLVMPKAQIETAKLRDIAAAFPEVALARRVRNKKGELVEKAIPYGIKDSPLYKKSRTEQKAVAAFADKLMARVGEAAKDPDLLAGYNIGLRWYDDFTPLLQQRYGEDAQIFAELLAATSPNTTPQVNFAFAERAYRRWKEGAFDEMMAKAQEGLDKIESGELAAEWEAARDSGELKQLQKKYGSLRIPPTPTDKTYYAYWIAKHDLMPRQAPRIERGQTVQPLFGMHSGAVLKVAMRRWLTKNAGLKTNNFVRNLLGQTDEATIDLWAARTMRQAGYEGFVDRWRILPQDAQAVSNPDFRFSQAVFREAAKRLGIRAHQLQGGLWFLEKVNWAKKGWSELDLGDYRTEVERWDKIDKRRREAKTAEDFAALAAEQEKLDAEMAAAEAIEDVTPEGE